MDVVLGPFCKDRPSYEAPTACDRARLGREGQRLSLSRERHAEIADRRIRTMRALAELPNYDLRSKAYQISTLAILVM